MKYSFKAVFKSIYIRTNFVTIIQNVMTEGHRCYIYIIWEIKALSTNLEMIAQECEADRDSRRLAWSFLMTAMCKGVARDKLCVSNVPRGASATDK